MPRKPPSRDELEDDFEEEEEEEGPEGPLEAVEQPQKRSLPASPPLPPEPAAQASTPIPTPAIRRPPPKTPKRDNGHGASNGVSLGAPPKQSTRWEEKDIDVLWGQVLTQLAEQGHSPYEVQVLVRTSGTEGWNRLGIIEGASAAGDGSISPGEALTRRLEDGFHLVSGNPGPGTYQLEIQWRANSQRIAVGRITLPPRAQILALREQQMRAGEGLGVPYGAPTSPGGRPGPTPGYPPQGYYPPTPHQGYYPPPYSPYGPYGSPPYSPYPPPQPQGVGQSPLQVPDTSRFFIEQLVDQLNQTRQELAALRNQPPPTPVVAPPPATAPPQPQPSFEEMVERATVKAVTLLVPQLRAGAGAPGTPSTALVPTTSTLEQQLQKQTGELMGAMLSRTLNVVAKGFERSMSTGLGAPEEVPAPPEEPEVLEPPKPEDSLPFTAIPLEAKYADGRPVVYAVSKETGKIDPMGAIFTNPIFAEKLADGVNALAKSAADAIQKISSGPNPHLVHRVPRAAQPAGEPKKEDDGWGGGQ